MVRRLGRSKFAQGALGFALAQYLRLVKRTNRLRYDPPDFDAQVAAHAPVIVAMWHGQHLMLPFAWTGSIARVAAMVSRHADGEAQAAALSRLGIIPVRGSGGPADRAREKGGAPALRELLRQLEAGASVAMTADVPKTARVAGLGIVTLARLSGRPIVPIAVAASRRFQFRSWDRASLGKPFGRVIVALGEPIRVGAGADDGAMQAARRLVEEGLDAVHRRAYGLVGGADPGADLRRS